MLKKRSDKKAFYGVPGEGDVITFTRMKFFTELSVSKNPVEYSRQYVDEDAERTDVVGYGPSMSFAFDEYTGNVVLEDITSIIDEEKVGTEAQREIIIVDFSSPATDGGFVAYKRTYSIIADSEGDSMEAYTYSGSMNSIGDQIKGVAVIATPEKGNSKTVETVTFTEDKSGE